METAVNSKPRISRHLFERKYLLSAARCFNGINLPTKIRHSVHIAIMEKTGVDKYILPGLRHKFYVYPTLL